MNPKLSSPTASEALGELIAKELVGRRPALQGGEERSARSQLFVATHSPDVLSGLLNVAPDHLRVLRIQRDGDLNRVTELDKQQAREIAAHPLTRYSSVLSGVFHRRVVICESDSDCTFYGALLDLPDVHGEQRPDVLFVHANGKHRMATLAVALQQLGVPTDIVADIDVLREHRVLEDIIRALGGDWNSIDHAACAVRVAVEEQKLWLRASEVKREVGAILDGVDTDNEFPKMARQKIDNVFRKISPWTAVKRAGRAAIPPGQATEHFDVLCGLCKNAGLWIVPVGEMEGFCRSVGGHGAGWVAEVLESRDLPTDAELGEARRFVHELWVAREEGE